MLNNISKEIFYCSVVPVAIIAVFVLLLLIIGRKNKNYYKYNYLIKIALTIMISLILSLMIGYTIWFCERVINMSSVFQNILYLVLLGVLVISLFVSLIIMFIKLHKDFKIKSA